MKPQHFLPSILLAAATASVSAQTIGTFTGGDPGDGLDLQGTFLYAIYGSNADEGTRQVQDAAFTFAPRNVQTGGVLISSGTETGFGDGARLDGGGTLNDQNIGRVTDYVYFSGGAPVLIDAAVSLGQQYQLQLLFNEACCNRGFDVFVEDVNVAPSFSPAITQGGISQPNGAVITYTFTAADTTLNVNLAPNGTFPDNNPIFDSFTLEQVPEPTSIALAMLGSAGLVALRRRRS